MDNPRNEAYFVEEQRFPLWIIAFPLLTAAVIGAFAVALAIGGLWPPAVVAGALFALLFLPLAVLHVVMRLVTTVDSIGLHLRVHPVGMNLLPRRMTQKDVPFSDIRRWEVRTYNSLTSREYWGWHLWGLGAAKGGRYLYIMRPNTPITGRGVQVELASGETLLIGSDAPERLADLIASGKRARS